MKKRACACVCRKKAVSLQPILKIERKPHPGSSTDGHWQSDRAELFTRSREVKGER